MKLDNTFKKIIAFLFPALFFFVPLFFTPANSELFEFNKIVLVYTLTILIAASWIGRMLVQKKIIFKRTFLDIPLVLFLVSQIISTLFSIDIHTSLYGYYSRFNGSLLSTACYLLLYWAYVSNCEAKDGQKIIKVSLISAGIISIYGILEHFGSSFSCLMFQGTFDVSCWVQKVQERVFATLGQPNWLAAYLAILIPVSWVKIIESKTTKALVLYSLLSTLYFLCLIFTGSRSGFLGLALGGLVFWISVLLLNRTRLNILSKPLLLTSSFLILAIVLFGSPIEQINKYFTLNGWKNLASKTNASIQVPPPSSSSTAVSVISEDGGISTSSDIRKIVWKGAFEIFKHYPLFGSGVETFAYSYYNFRPMEHNQVSEWDFLYNKAHNEYLNFLSTTGAFGLGTYLLFIVSFVILIIKSIKEKNHNTHFLLLTAIFSGWLSILVTNFFGFSVVITSLYLFAMPALCGVLTSKAEDQKKLSASKINPFSIPLIALLLITCYLLLSTVNYWRADFFYAKAIKLAKNSNYPDAYQYYYKAKNLNPNEPVFLGEISSTTANLAVMSYSEKNPSGNSTDELISLAISYSDLAKKISPKNLNILKSRVRTFYTLSLIKPDYIKEAISTMEDAIKLAPTDPKLVYNLGLLYGKTGNTKLTIETIEKAVQMKPNYADARNALVLFYEESGEKAKELEELKVLLKISPENAEGFQKKIDKLEGR